jgi:hypothetical protein
MQLQLGAIGYLGLLQAENTCDTALLASFRRRRRGTPRRPRCSGARRRLVQPHRCAAV